MDVISANILSGASIELENDEFVFGFGISPGQGEICGSGGGLDVDAYGLRSGHGGSVGCYGMGVNVGGGPRNKGEGGGDAEGEGDGYGYECCHDRPIKRVYYQKEVFKWT